MRCSLVVYDLHSADVEDVLFSDAMENFTLLAGTLRMFENVLLEVEYVIKELKV